MSDKYLGLPNTNLLDAVRDNNYLEKISPAQSTNKKKKKRQAARDKQTHTQEHKETKKETQESA